MATRPPCAMVKRFLKMIEQQGILEDALSASTTGGSLVLKVDAMTALFQDYNLGNWLLRDTDGLRMELIQALALGNVISSIAVPVWIRPHSVPMPLSYDVNCAAKTQPGSLVRFSGIVAQMSAVRQRIYCRRLRCPHCGAINEILEHQSKSFCRCEVIDGDFEEDLSARRLIPTQTLSLSCIPWACKVDGFGGASYVKVDVDDDLCGVCCLGDIIELWGCVETRPLSAGLITNPHQYVFAETKVHCHNMSTVSPWNIYFSTPKACSTGAGFFLGSHILHSLCEGLGEACTQQLPPSLGIALLLSTVMIGSPRTEAARNQIHVLVTSDGYDPGAVRLLQEIANLIAPISLTHSNSSGPMKCYVTSSGDESSDVTVAGNDITSTRNGILVMETTHMKKGNKDHVTDCLGRAFIQPHPADEFIIPMTPTLWASHCINGAPKPQKQGTKRTSTKSSTLGVELGEGLLSQIDIVVPNCLRLDPLYDSMSVERILRLNEDEASSKSALSSVARLREHLGWVGQNPCPTMSSNARALLQRYYMTARNYADEEFQVHTSVLPSLVRIATASARLCGRSRVQESPDVGLAIKLVEEAMVAKEVYSRPSPLLMCMDSVMEKSQAMSIDQELDCLQSTISNTLCKDSRCWEKEE